MSILLPVYNAQHRLAQSVAKILDVLPELTDQFELFIIDDGSTDDTIDVARQLALEYPQVGAVRHPLRLGLTEAVQTGLDNTVGDIVFVGDEQHGLDPEHLRSLWPLKNQQPITAAQGQSVALHTGRPEDLLATKRSSRQIVADIRIIRRDESGKSLHATRSADLGRRIDRPHPACGKPRSVARVRKRLFAG